MMKQFCVLMILTLCMTTVDGFGLTSCDDMRPSGTVNAQTSPPPYSVSVSANQYENGVPISVTLEATEVSVSFVDFFLVAKCTSCSNTSIPVGSFTNLPAEAELIPCYNTLGAIAASDLSSKTTLTVTWIPPNDFSGVVVMTSSVVQGTNTWWGQIKSVNIERKPIVLEIAGEGTTIAARKPPPKTSTTTTTTTSATQCSSASMLLMSLSMFGLITWHVL